MKRARRPARRVRIHRNAKRRVARRVVRRRRHVNRRCVNRPRPRRRPNPEATFIGDAPTLYVSGVGKLDFPRGELLAGTDHNSVYLDLGGDKAPPVGAKVTRIDYDDPEKAVEAYKEIARFRHDCKDPFIIGPAQDGLVVLSSKSVAWKGE